MMDDHRHRFRDAHQDIETAKGIPDTPQTRSPSYALAFADPEFLCREELRPVRLQLELLKPEMLMAEYGIKSTVVLFGGARIPDPVKKKGENVIVTGGGPGVMEAGNRGAEDAGGVSIGLNIVLPHEQAPNSYVTPELAFNFHYFGIRKMHFLMRASAIAVFPGGFGTLDELFETLTLIQTGRMERVPFLLFGRKFWETIINWDALSKAGTISADDIDLFRFVDTADEAMECMDNWHLPATKRDGIPGR
jgi:uncharacterized protein (TIGR00730 family)